MSWLVILLGCVARAFGLQQLLGDSEARPKAVLMFGCSLDRNAIRFHCGGDLQTKEFLMAHWCYDALHDTRFGFLFHPGVGKDGDLRPPFFQFWIPNGPSTEQILQNPSFAHDTSWDMLKGDPDLVVVDSSLWDLAGWMQANGANWQLTGGNAVSEERVQQWCSHDLPNLLEKVQAAFPKIRVAFRTAPTVTTKFSEHDVELLYSCVSSSLKGGKLFGKYEVIDYHAIVKKAIKERGLSGMFLTDGYHPAKYPSALYINEILRRIGKHPDAPPLPNANDSLRFPRLAHFWDGSLP